MLADYTTLGLGGPARDFVSADTEQGLIDAVRSADRSGVPVLLIGGGSNLVISDEGFPGKVVHVNTRGFTYVDAGDGAVSVTVAAGEDWDGVVAATVAEGLAGLEALSGIPGRAGATPIQNVGAYGREVAEVITQVRVYDRQEDQVRHHSERVLRILLPHQPLQERPAGIAGLARRARRLRPRASPGTWCST